MASALKWAGAIAGASAALALLILSWDLDPARWRPERTPAELVRDSLREELDAAANHMVQLAALEHVLEALPPQPALRVALPDSGAASALSDRVAGIIGTGVRREPSRARLLVTVMRPQDADVFSTPSGFYAGRDAHGPYCARVLDRRWTSGLRGEPPGLGPCEFWARYGAPGPQIGRWVQQGGWLFARGTGVMAPPDTLHRRGLFGIQQRRLSGSAPPLARSCLAGVLESCRHFVLDTVPAVGPRMGPPRWYWGRLSEREGELLGYLEQRYGRDAFARFWNSDQPVEAAFAAAFGAPLAVWVRDWARTYHGTEPHGPGLGFWNGLLAVLTLAALAGAGVAVVMRRRVH